MNQDDIKHDDDNEFDHDDDANFDEFDDEFGDFDETKKGSLKEVWQSNPLLKLFVVGVILLVIIAALFLFGGKTEEVPSSVKGAVNAKELPGLGELNEDMKGRITEANEDNYEYSEATNSSFLPVSTTTFQEGQGQDEQGFQPDESDPLAEWRNRQRTKVVEPPKEELVEITEPVVQPVVAQPQPQILRPDPEMVTALGSGFAAQMEQILLNQSIRGSNHMEVTPSSFLTRNDVDDENGVDDNNPIVNENGIAREILLPAGTVVYAQTLTEANTDAPGPVLAQILSGPLKGSRIIGGFSETEKFLTMSFDQIVVKGQSLSVDGIALNTETTLPGIVTEIDRRYFKRVVLPAAASFIEGFGEAVAETGGTSVVVQGETITTSEDDLDTREELLSGVEEATSVVAEFLEEEADNTPVMIRVAAGTPIGILFISPVEREIGSLQ